MKPVYLALTFAIAALMGCSNEKSKEPVTSTSSEQEEVSAVDAKKYEPCVIPEVEGYQQVGCLRDGLAGVLSVNEAEPYDAANRVGYIDEEGKVVIPFEYDAIVAGEGGESFEFNDFSEGLAAVSKNEKFGFINTKGELVVPFEYEWVSNFSDGLAVVHANGLSGAIDKTGKVVIPIEYDVLNDFNDGLASAANSSQDSDYKYGLIDKDNNVVVPFEYDNMGDFSEGLIAVQKDGKWGYIDQANKAVIPIDLAYEQVNNFSNGLAAVFNYEENSDNLKYGYIDKTGKLVIPMSFTKAFWESSKDKIDFKNGYAIVNDYEGEEFCIDTKGKKAECPEGIVSRPRYSSNDEYSEEEGMTEEQQAVDSDGARFSNITDYLALKPSQQWTWDQLASIPDVQEWRNKTPVKDEYQEGSTNLLIEARLTDTGFMTAYGTQKEPKIIVLSSGQGVMEDENLSGVYEVTEFFNLNELVRIKSNCDVDGYMFDQKFYKWQKKGFQPLYVSSSYMGGNAGAESKIGIAESIDELFSSKYDDSYLGLQSVDQNYNDVVCTFDE